VAIDITITIPGDAATEGTAAYRLKQAIDWHYQDRNNQPQTAAQYKAIVAQELKAVLRAYVRRAEYAQAKHALTIPGDIDVDEG